MFSRGALVLALGLGVALGSINQKWPGIDEKSFIWPNQWQGIQEIHLASGPYVGAVQKGRIVYDYTNLRTREVSKLCFASQPSNAFLTENLSECVYWTVQDQVLVSGPSVKSNYTSNNMTEWFHNSTWFYMDWTTGECMSNDFGIGMVLPDWLVHTDYPMHTGTSFIFTYLNNTDTRGYVNTTWIQTDGSAGFGLPAGTNLFDWHLDNEGVPRRLHMPSTLAADLMIDLTDYNPAVTLEDTALPEACLHPYVQEWPHGPVTPMASRFAAFWKDSN